MLHELWLSTNDSHAITVPHNSSDMTTGEAHGKMCTAPLVHFYLCTATLLTQLVLRAAGFQLTPAQAGSASAGRSHPSCRESTGGVQFPRMQCKHNTQQRNMKHWEHAHRCNAHAHARQGCCGCNSDEITSPPISLAAQSLEELSSPPISLAAQKTITSSRSGAWRST